MGIYNPGSGTLSWSEGVQTVKVHLSSAQILALNSTPVTLIPAPGIGKYIQVLGIDGSLVFGTAPYATNINLIAYMNASAPRFANSQILGVGANNKSPLQNSGYGLGVISENTAFRLMVTGGNPTGGDGTFDAYITYKIVSL